MIITLSVTENANGLRIDKFISNEIENMTRSHIQQLIQTQSVTVNNHPIKSNYKCKENDFIQIEFEEAKELDVIPQNIPLDIVYEDNDILIVNKPKGMVVHPSNGHPDNTLVNALLYHCKDRLSSINGVIRPGIVHRIDQNTTGLLVVCKNDFAHNFLAEQLSTHSITRKYHAICCGIFKEKEGTINAPIGRHPKDRKKMSINEKNGKPAITHYKVLEELSEQYSYVECHLETGRTHQIRVHMASIGHSILGDDVYGKINTKEKSLHLQGQTLHAKVLGFIHPETKEYIEFDSALPDYFIELLGKL